MKNKRKLSTDNTTKKTKRSKKCKSNKETEQSTQEALINIEEQVVKNLIDFESGEDVKGDDDNVKDSNNDDQAKNDSDDDDLNDSISTSLDDFCFSPNLPNRASIPVVISSQNEQIQESSIQKLLETVFNIKDTMDQVLESNKLLTAEVGVLKRSNTFLKKKLKEQQKLTKVTIIQVAKLEKTNKKLLNKKKNSNCVETVDEMLVPIIQERDNLKDELNSLKLANSLNHDSSSFASPTNTTYSTAVYQETLEDKKIRVLPRWRQLYFRRRDEYKREFRNRQKAKIYEEYYNNKFLPRKFRPKFARTQEEYNVKEDAQLKSLDANRKCCIMDADQALSNVKAADKEALDHIQQSAADENEAYYLKEVWTKEVTEAEPKSRLLCQNELNFLQNLPYTDQYKGFSGISKYATQVDNTAVHSDNSYSSYHGQSQTSYNQTYDRNTDNNTWRTVTPRNKRWRNHRNNRNAQHRWTTPQPHNSNQNSGSVWRSFGDTDYRRGYNTSQSQNFQ